MFYIARQNDRENGSKIDRKIASFRIFGTRNDEKNVVAITRETKLSVFFRYIYRFLNDTLSKSTN